MGEHVRQARTLERPKERYKRPKANAGGSDRDYFSLGTDVRVARTHIGAPTSFTVLSCAFHKVPPYSKIPNQ